MNKLSQVILLFWCFANFSAHAQESNLHITKIPASSDTILLDSLTIYEPSMQVYCGGRLLSPSTYYFNGLTREFLFKGSCADSLFLLYRVFEIDFNKVYQKKILPLFSKLKVNEKILSTEQTPEKRISLVDPVFKNLVVFPEESPLVIVRTCH